MKVIFELDFEKDRQAVQRMVKATDMAIVLSTLQYNTKKKIDWWIAEETDNGRTPKPYDVLKKFFHEFHSLLEDQSIIIDDIIS